MKAIFILIFSLSILHIFASSAYGQKKQIKASFCSLSLAEDIKQANVTFTNSYRFKISADSRPIKISRISGYDFINNDEVEICFNSWSFTNFAENTSVIVQIGWRHSYGWQPIKIISKDYSKTLKPSH